MDMRVAPICLFPSASEGTSRPGNAWHGVARIAAIRVLAQEDHQKPAISIPTCSLNKYHLKEFLYLADLSTPRKVKISNGNGKAFDAPFFQQRGEM